MSKPSTVAAPERDPVEQALSAIASAITALHKAEATGDLAALRRMDPERPEEMAFLRLSVMRPVSVAIEEMEGELGAVEALRRFAAIAQIMALRPAGLRRWGLGRDLAAIGATDLRLGVLLTAKDAALRDIVRRLARRLARDVDALAYEDLGMLLVCTGWRDATAEETRIKIARDFARAERSKASASSQAAT